MNIEVVSTTKQSQRLSDASAAVFVITAEAIRRSGATNIPALLRMVPGVQVMLEDIDRIEVIRGPGASLWGANAVNLVGNAVKFTERGEVVIRVDGQAGDTGAMRLRFEVADTGIGIAAEHQAHIFESFSQADSSTTRTYGGTGLGLTISKHLVALMGGEISLDSRSGKGARFGFSLQLPRVPGAVPAVSAPSVNLRGLPVLVVDDNATNRDILCHQLRSWGMEVSCLAGGSEALAELRAAAAEARPYRLVLLDRRMPGMDGLALARAIGRDAGCGAPALLMLSSVDNADERQACQDSGIRWRLTKPVRRADLYQAVTETLTDGGAAAQARPSEPAPMAGPGVEGRVLLVEDNPVNREFALELLAQLGVQTQVADNGLVALEKLAEQSFDLVLMDCQMPEMDGYEATTELRRREAARGARRLPVVALTANALQGDREACLAAGMDDYLAKPFGKGQLRELLQRWLIPMGRPRPDRPPPAVEQSLPLDPQVLGRLRAMGRAPDFFRRLVQTYLDKSSQDLERLRAAVAAGDAEAVRRAAHSLKSGSANLGALTLAALCKELEGHGRRGELDRAGELLGAVERAHRLSIEALRHESGVTHVDDR